MSSQNLIHKRYNIIKEILLPNESLFRENIIIKHYIAKDFKAGGNVLCKEIILGNEMNSDIFQEMWFREINIAKRISSLDEGNVLLNLIDAFREETKSRLWIIYQYAGDSIYEILKGNLKDNEMEFFLNPVNRKIFWENILKIANAIKLLHDNLIFHRNISYKTIFFKGERDNFIELKLGDFSLTLYLYGLDSILKSEKKRLPKRKPSIFNPKTSLEGLQSDIFSFGMTILCLKSGIEIDLIEKQDLTYDEKYTMILQNFRNKKTILDFEKNFLEKICLREKTSEYSNMNEVISDIRKIISKCVYFETNINTLPITTVLDQENQIIVELSKNYKLKIQDILLNPDEFFEKNFVDIELYISNNPNKPFIFSLNNMRFCLTKSSVQKIAKLVLLSENDKTRKLTKDLEPISIKKLEFIETIDPHKFNYVNWRSLWLYAKDKIEKSREEHYLQTEFEKNRFNAIMQIILNAEYLREIKKNFFPYRVINKEKDRSDRITANIYVASNRRMNNDLDSLIENSIYNKIHIFEDERIDFLPSSNEWKYEEIKNTKDGFIFKIKSQQKNQNISGEGFLVFSEFIGTRKLLKRKTNSIINLISKVSLTRSLIDPYTYSKNLKISQSDDELIKLIQNTQPLFILQGPPGTGKTFYAKKLIVEEINKAPYYKAFITCKEHNALNDLMRKVIQDIGQFKKKPIIIRITSREVEFALLKDEILKKYLDTTVAREQFDKFVIWVRKNKSTYPKIFDLISDIPQDLSKLIITEEWIEVVKKSANLIFSTNMSHGTKYMNDNNINFDLIVEEEAGKCFPSEMIAPMLNGQKWVLIGDQNQLPPFDVEEINKIIMENFSNEIRGLSRSYELSEFEVDIIKNDTFEYVKIFEKLFNLLKKQFSNEEDYPYSILKTQWRLPSKIAKLIADIFYDDLDQFELKSIDPEPDFIQEPRFLQNNQLIWITTPNNNPFLEDKSSHYSNLNECKIIATLLKKIEMKNPFEDSIAILTPYKDQVNRLKELIPSSKNGMIFSNNVYTVDSYQGQQADVIVLSLVRNNLIPNERLSYGFLSNIERLNVMLSRSKKILIVVGSFKFFNNRIAEKSHIFNKITEFFLKYGVIINYQEILRGK